MDDVNRQDAVTGGDGARQGSASPWWYHPAMGASMAVAVGMGSFSWDLIPYAVIVGVGIVPAALTAVVDRRNGMAAHRYSATASARRASGGYLLALVLLIVAGVLVQWGAGLPWAMAGCGALVLILTVVCGRRIETRALAGLRQGSA
ncbi:hypothetical protein [Nocardiopsis coralliicola]